jgi:hypothetical protein
VTCKVREPVVVTEAKLSATEGICAVIINNPNVGTIIKLLNPFRSTKDCLSFHSFLQRKSLRWNIVRILQREQKTLQIVIRVLIPL